MSKGAEVSPRDAKWGPGNALPWNAMDSVLVFLLLLVVFACYGSVLTFEFVYDDEVLIVKNPLLVSWRFIPGYFAQHVASQVYPGVPGNYYRPVLLLWLLVNRKLWGLHPSGWHFSTLTLHAVAALGVYLLARRILKDRAAASLAAVVFGLHPVHVESVSWVMGVTEPLACVLCIFSFLSYLKGRGLKQHGGIWYAGSLLLYALAIFSKETAAVLPAIIFAYEWFFYRARDDSLGKAGRPARMRACVAPVVPYLALTGAYLVARATVLEGLAHAITPIPLKTLVSTWPLVIWNYLRLLVWPVGLGAFYDVPYVTDPGLMNFVLPGTVLAGAVAAVALWSKRSREVAFASLWLALPILPLLNLTVFPEGEIVHDRYLYLPSVGFALLVAIALSRLNAGRARFFGHSSGQVLAALALTAFLGEGVVFYSRFWSNNLPLYQRGVAVAPRSNLATNNLANELLARGQYEAATRLYQQVLDRSPNYWLSNYNLGYSFYKLGRVEEAQRYLERAIEIDSSDPDQFVYLGLTQLRRGQIDQAETAIRRAIARRSDGVGYHFALGLVLKMRGQVAAALNEFRTELANHPNEMAAQRQISEIEARLSPSRTGQTSSPLAPSSLAPQKHH